MSDFHGSASRGSQGAQGRTPPPPTRGTRLRHRLAELRGPGVPAKALDARALAALAANPGCRRRAILDGAGVDKGALASALGSPAAFGQSQFAIVRGNAFEARVMADGGAEVLRLVREKLDRGGEPPADARVPDLSASGPEGRTARTALALREAAGSEASGAWTLLHHPMLALEVAGSPVFLEPDAVVVHPDGSWTVVEIKSFPMLDGSADPAKVGAAARQAAVYVLALEKVAARLDPPARVRHRILLVCPKDFSNLPTASAVDVRKQRAVTDRQLTRLTRIEDIADALPEGACFSPALPVDELTAAVEAVPAAYAPECLSACELAFHCRARSREADAVTPLGRSVRAELGGLSTVTQVLAAAHGDAGDPDDPAVAALRRAAALRAEALGTTTRTTPGAQAPAKPEAGAPQTTDTATPTTTPRAETPATATRTTPGAQAPARPEAGAPTGPDTATPTTTPRAETPATATRTAPDTQTPTRPETGAPTGPHPRARTAALPEAPARPRPATSLPATSLPPGARIPAASPRARATPTTEAALPTPGTPTAPPAPDDATPTPATALAPDDATPTPAAPPAPDDATTPQAAPPTPGSPAPSSLAPDAPDPGVPRPGLPAPAPALAPAPEVPGGPAARTPEAPGAADGRFGGVARCR